MKSLSQQAEQSLGPKASVYKTELRQGAAPGLNEYVLLFSILREQSEVPAIKTYLSANSFPYRRLNME